MRGGGGFEIDLFCGFYFYKEFKDSALLIIPGKVSTSVDFPRENEKGHFRYPAFARARTSNDKSHTRFGGWIQLGLRYGDSCVCIICICTYVIYTLHLAIQLVSVSRLLELKHFMSPPKLLSALNSEVTRAITLTVRKEENYGCIYLYVRVCMCVMCVCVYTEITVLSYFFIFFSAYQATSEIEREATARSR